jgi:hypothetical protein
VIACARTSSQLGHSWRHTRPLMRGWAGLGEGGIFVCIQLLLGLAPARQRTGSSEHVHASMVFIFMFFAGVPPGSKF